jgi:hypothetical protein
VDALRVEVQSGGHEVDVPGPLAVSEQTALHSVGASHLRKLGGSHGASPASTSPPWRAG